LETLPKNGELFTYIEDIVRGRGGKVYEVTVKRVKKSIVVNFTTDWWSNFFLNRLKEGFKELGYVIVSWDIEAVKTSENTKLLSIDLHLQRIPHRH